MAGVVAGGMDAGVEGAFDGAALEFAGGCAVPPAGCGCTGTACGSGVTEGVDDAGEASEAPLLLVASGAVVVVAAGFFARTFSHGKP